MDQLKTFVKVSFEKNDHVKFAHELYRQLYQNKKKIDKSATFSPGARLLTSQKTNVIKINQTLSEQKQRADTHETHLDNFKNQRNDMCAKGMPVHLLHTIWCKSIQVAYVIGKYVTESSRGMCVVSLLCMIETTPCVTCLQQAKPHT